MKRKSPKVLGEISECCKSLVTTKKILVGAFPFSQAQSICLNCNKICTLKIIYATDTRQAEKKTI